MCVTIVTSYLSLTIWCFNPYINPDAVIHQGPSKVWPTVQFLQLFETSTEIWHSGSELINPLIDLQRPVVKKCFIHSRVVRLRNWIANFSKQLGTKCPQSFQQKPTEEIWGKGRAQRQINVCEKKKEGASNSNNLNNIGNTSEIWLFSNWKMQRAIAPSGRDWMNNVLSVFSWLDPS